MEYLCEVIVKAVTWEFETNKVKENFLELIQEFDRIKYGFQNLSEMMKV